MGFEDRDHFDSDKIRRVPMACSFKTEEVKPCIEHALSGTGHRMGWSEEPPQPALFFVHDQGIYLMTNATRTKEEVERGDRVAYAKGCNPKKDEDFYERSRYLVGGDDFADTLPVSEETLKLCDQFRNMGVRIAIDEIVVTFSNPILKKVV
jgi:uncharacterized protein YozE (UPF0346 family)